jgi:hypothetical protein
MKKYQILQKGDSGPVTLVQREGDQDIPVAYFYPVAGQKLIRVIAGLMATALEAGREDICLVQEATTQGKASAITLVADRVGVSEGFAEIDLAVYRAEPAGSVCLAHVVAGVDAEGVPRVRIKSRGTGASKKAIEISLAGASAELNGSSHGVK